jgi:hypoxanthine phosphoribosyltransferase
MPLQRRVNVLFDESSIAKRNTEIALDIAKRQPKDLLVVAILKGSFMFAADLMRAMHHAGLTPQVEFMHLSSYRDATVSSGQVAILKDVESDVRDRDVVLVDDILESGRTIAFAKDLLAARGARVMTCCLLRSRASVPCQLKRILSGLNALTFSWSAMAWMWRIASVNCRLSAWSTRSDQVLSRTIAMFNAVANATQSA